MEKMFNSIQYKELFYLLNSETGRYEKQPKRIPFQKLPFELKVEETQEQIIKNNGANEIITGRIKDKKRLFFTGLIPAYSKNWYYGNDYCFINGSKRNSLVIFNFSNDNSKLIIYYFHFYYKENRQERERFINTFIDTTLQKNGTNTSIKVQTLPFDIDTTLQNDNREQTPPVTSSINTVGNKPSVLNNKDIEK